MPHTHMRMKYCERSWYVPPSVSSASNTVDAQ